MVAGDARGNLAERQRKARPDGPIAKRIALRIVGTLPPRREYPLSKLRHTDPFALRPHVLSRTISFSNTRRVAQRLLVTVRPSDRSGGNLLFSRGRVEGPRYR